MGMAAPSPTLHRLRQTLAGIDPNLASQGLAPRLAGEERPVALGAPIDAALGGGLACGALHELAPAAPDPSGGRERICRRARRAGERGAAAAGALGCHRFRGGRGRRTLRSRPRPVRAGARAPHRAARAARRSMCSGRWRRRCAAARSPASSPSSPATARRPISPRRAGSRSPRAKAGGGSGLGLLLRHRADAGAERGGDPLGDRRGPSRPDAFGGLGRTRFRPFSPQEPARTVRPVDRRLGSS